MLSARIKEAKARKLEADRVATAAREAALREEESDTGSDLGEKGLDDGHDDGSSDTSSAEVPAALRAIGSSYALRRHLSEPDAATFFIPAEFPECMWWARPVLNAVQGRASKLGLRGLARPLQILSFCSGILSEVFAARALGIPCGATVACEIDEEAAKFSKHLHRGHIGHLFDSMSCLEGTSIAGECFQHNGYCAQVQGLDFDVAIGGPECTPFSKLRRGGCGPEEHPKFKSLFGNTFDEVQAGLPVPGGSVIDVLTARRPKGFIFENVKDINSKTKQGLFSTTTPLTALVDRIKLINKSASDPSSLYTAFEVFSMNSADWVTAPRPRCPRKSQSA
jgi:hypothetical protein